MEGGERLLEERTEWCVFGRSTVAESCTRYATPIIFFVAVLIFLFQLPGHKGTVTSVDFHPKEPISEHLSFLLIISLTLLEQS
jgi:hypothetical protein